MTETASNPAVNSDAEKAATANVISDAEKAATANVISNIAQLLRKGLFFGDNAGYVAEAIAFCDNTVAKIKADLPPAPEAPKTKLKKVKNG